jgi:hypothetical protein
LRGLGYVERTGRIERMEGSKGQILLD